MTFLFRFILFTVLIFSGFNYSHAAVYYVATTGSNSNVGSSTKPWRNIAYAVSKMNPGDTTYVRGGIYNETSILFGKSGTSSAPIKLLNVAGQNPVINFTAKTSANRILIQNSAGYNKAMGYITIEGFEIRNGYNGIKFYNLHNSSIRSNWIHHNISQGLLGGGHHIIFDRNRVNRNGNFVGCAAGQLTSIGTSVCNQDHGFYLHGTYLTITNNLIYDNLAFGIQVNGSSSAIYSSASHAGTAFAGAKNWTIANNTFAYNVNRAGMTLWGTPSGMRIENNIFYENCSKNASLCAYVQGISMSVGVRDTILRNNLFYASGSGALLPYRADAKLGREFSTNTGNITTEAPLLASAPATMPSSPNFALTSKSPAINRGVANSVAGVSFNGLARPRGGYFDIGAYEY